MTRTAREVVELYNLVVWNERDFALADELMGDTVIRHEVGEAHTLTHEQAVQRIVDTWEMFDKLRFDLNSWSPETTASTSRSSTSRR